GHGHSHRDLGAWARRDRRPAAYLATGNPRRSDVRRRAVVLDGVPRLGRRRRVRFHHSAEASAPGTTRVTGLVGAQHAARLHEQALCMLPRWRYIPAPASRFTTQTDTIRHRALWMTKRSGRVGAGVAIALSIAFPVAAQTGQSASGYKAPVISDTGRLKGPRQPIFFRHDIHAGQDQIPCLYCHSTVTISSEPGIPAVQTCFGCHQIIGGSTDTHKAEIQKVRQAWATKQPPVWTRVHALPGFVRFPHQRHIKILGTESCINCHGEVRTMPPENQVPGIATYYATTCRECAAGCGLHAKAREGRVVKLEGNPESPINQGRLCSRGQAGLQGLYNPDRVTDPMARGPNGEWQKLS